MPEVNLVALTFPTTDSFDVGAVVPIPTLPATDEYILLPLSVQSLSEPVAPAVKDNHVTPSYPSKSAPVQRIEPLLLLVVLPTLIAPVNCTSPATCNACAGLSTPIPNRLLASSQNRLLVSAPNAPALLN